MSTEPIWSDQEIEDALLAKAEPTQILVEEAQVVAVSLRDQYEHELATVTAERDALQEQLDDLQEPVDFTVTVGAEAVATSMWRSGMQDVDSALMDGIQANRDLLAEVCEVGATHVMNFGAPNLWKDQNEPGPHLWGRLDQRMDMFVEMGLEPMLIFYNYPVWMKEIVNKDGTTTPCDPNDPFTDEGRLAPEFYDQAHIYYRDIALRYFRAPYNVRVCVYGNELKGYVYCRDGSEGKDIADYTEHYNLWTQAMEEAAVQLGIDPLDLKLGGPYSPIRCEGEPSKDTYDEGHPYGYYRWSPLDAIDYWLAHNIRADFIACDMGAGNAEGPELVETFTVQQTKFVDVANWIRQRTDLPIVVCEFYPKCADDHNALAQRVAAAKTVAHLSCIYAGYWMLWQWGAIGQGEYDLENKNGGMLRDYKSGEVNPWYGCYGILREHFSAGAKLYPVQVEGAPGGSPIYAGSNGNVLVLVNMTDGDRKVRYGADVHTLVAHEVLDLPVL